MAEMPHIRFYCGDDFRVLLNNTDKVKLLLQVKHTKQPNRHQCCNPADADEVINIGADGMMTPLDISAIDDATGKLEGTVFRKCLKPRKTRFILWHRNNFLKRSGTKLKWTVKIMAIQCNMHLSMQKK